MREGESDPELAADGGKVGRLNRAAVGFDNLSADREAKTSAFFAPGGFYGKATKVLEELVVLVLGNSRSLVPDRETAGAARRLAGGEHADA
jgi:hypothetical protein